MEAHHASLGRRKLEEIRQKKAAEKGSNFLSSIASTDYNAASGKTNSIDGNARAWIQNPERDHQEQEFRETDLPVKLQAFEAERKTLQQQQRKMEESMNVSIENLKMEKDAAVRSRDDLVAQLRILKKRLQEAEEEQYKAEEDAAALRAEIEVLHRREDHSNMIPPSSTSEQFRSMEQEMARVKVELQDAVRQLQQEQQKLDIERQHVMDLTMEREQMKNAFNEAQQKLEDHHASSTDKLLATDLARDDASSSTFITIKESQKVKTDREHQLRELASMIERLESGRQKLLVEIDSQSVEIERLFLENGSLATGLKEASEFTAQWERQVQECLEQNALLCAELNDLRMKQAQISSLQPSESLGNQLDAERVELSNLTDGASESMSMRKENSKLKVELDKTKGQAEALGAQVLQLSVELNRARKHISTFNWVYKPVLANIKYQLLQLKQDGDHMDVVL